MATELVIVETQRGTLTVAQPGGLGAPGKPGGDGDPGPTAVSADEGNAATLGSDGLLFVPESVDSVNGQTGTVVLDADDVGAAPTSRSVTAGYGLVGGGTLSADRTLAVAVPLVVLDAGEPVPDDTPSGAVILHRP